MKISNKILAGFILIIFLFSSLMVLNHNINLKEDRFHDAVINIEMQEQVYLGNMIQVINELGMDSYEMIVANKSSEIEHLHELEKEFTYYFDMMSESYEKSLEEKTDESEDEKWIYQENYQKLKELEVEFEKLEKTIEKLNTNPNTDSVMVLKEIENSVDIISDELKGMLAKEIEYVAFEYAEQKKNEYSLNLMLIIFIMLFLIVSVTIAYYSSKKLKTMIFSIDKSVESLKKGDLTQKMVVTDANDELSAFSKIFNSFTENMSILMKKSRDATFMVEASANELLVSNQKIEKNSKRVVATIDIVSKGAEDQNKKMGDAKIVIDNYYSNLQKLLSNAEKVSISIDETNKYAQKGAEYAKSAKDKIKVMEQSVNDSAKNMSSLGDKTNEVGNILKVINDIADQTNLLALNAAIEAARAGDAGRGFAVVADEVRKLAEESQKAAKQISEILQNIQQESSLSMVSIEKTVKDMGQSSETINNALKLLNDIADTMNATAENAKTNLSITQNQEKDMKSIKETIGAISETAEANFAATTEVSYSIKEQEKSTLIAEQLANELIKTSEELTNMVKSFKYE